MAKQFSVLFLVLLTSQTFQIATSEFCSCDLSNNVNLDYQGENNHGFIECNRNFVLRTSDCQFNLRSNVDARITKNNSNVDCTSCTDFYIVGHDNRIISRSNTNSHFSGNNNVWDTTSNTGSTLRSTYSDMILRSNIDSNIQGDDANLYATSNTRLTVTGTGYRADIRDTTDHTYNGRRETSRMSGNSLEISLENGAPKVSIEFADETSTDGRNYKIGKFAFTLSAADNGRYEIKMNGTSGRGLIQQRVFSRKEIRLTMKENGRRHSLRIKGDLVTSNPDRSISLFAKRPSKN